MSIKIKVHLIKTLIIPVLDYPPIPTHALSKSQISILQKIQNKALRYAYNQRHPYTMNTMQLHEAANIEPINIRLHYRAAKIWDTIQTQQIPLYTQLTENMGNIQHYNRHFPSSLNTLNNPPPEPCYH